MRFGLNNYVQISPPFPRKELRLGLDLKWVEGNKHKHKKTNSKLQ